MKKLFSFFLLLVSVGMSVRAEEIVIQTERYEETFYSQDSITITCVYGGIGKGFELYTDDEKFHYATITNLDSSKHITKIELARAKTSDGKYDSNFRGVLADGDVSSYEWYSEIRFENLSTNKVTLTKNPNTGPTWIRQVKLTLEDGAPAQGTCGENLTWKYKPQNKELVISGTGAMTDYTDVDHAPWYDLRNDFTKVTFPDGLTTIGAHAFQGCANPSFTTVDIPEGVTFISLNAFYGCSALTTVTIPSTATLWGGVFYNCRALSSITCYAESPQSKLPWTVFASVNKSTCTLYVPYLSLEDYKVADEWKNFEHIEAVPPTYTATAGSGGVSDDEDHSKLVDGKFLRTNCTKWCAKSEHKSVPTGEDVEACWWLDFHSRVALAANGYILTTGEDSGKELGRNPKSWIIKGKLNEGDDWTVIATVTDDAKLQDLNLTDYKFKLDVPGTYQYFRFEVLANNGSDVMQLCELRFIDEEGGEEPAAESDPEPDPEPTYSCGGGLTWELSDNVLTISYDGTGTGEMHDYSSEPGSEAPWNAHKSEIQTIIISDGVKSIGSHAFSDCTALTAITCETTTPPALGSDVFSGIDGKASIPLYVPSESVDAFNDADEWKAFDVQAIPVPVIPDWVRDGDEWDADTKTLTVNSIPEEYAYRNQTEIEHLIIHDNVTRIDRYAFDGCSNLVSVVCGIQLDTILNNSFRYCSNLTSVEFSHYVKVFGDYVFYYCTSLTSITLPKSVTDLGYGVFFGCSGLESVTCKAVTPPAWDSTYPNADMFKGATKLKHIYVPTAAVDAYKAADGWKDSVAIIEGYGEDPEEFIFQTSMSQSSYTQEPVTITCKDEGNSFGMYLDGYWRFAFVHNTGSTTISRIELVPGYYGDNHAYVRANGEEPSFSCEDLITFTNVNSNYVTLSSYKDIYIKEVRVTLGGEPEPDPQLQPYAAFTVDGGGKVVYFAKGNLQATTQDYGEHWTWTIAKNEWNRIGESRSDNSSANTCIIRNGVTDKNGTVDLFGWSTNANYFGINSSDSYDDFKGDFIEWGSTIGEGWRTLTVDEWKYLFDYRPNAYFLRGQATVNGVHGYIILPDKWIRKPGMDFEPGNARTWDDNVYSGEAWTAMQNTGVVFLPTAGVRSIYNRTDGVDSYGEYWSSSPSENYPNSARYVYFDRDDSEGAYTSDRREGRSVRLVTETIPTIDPSGDDPDPSGDEPKVVDLTYTAENADIEWQDKVSADGYWEISADDEAESNYVYLSCKKDKERTEAAGTYTWGQLGEYCSVRYYDESHKYIGFTDGSCEVTVDGKDIVVAGSFTGTDGNTYNISISFTVSTEPDVPTAIDNSAVTTKATKGIENGQLLIIRDGKIYNVVGTTVR